MAGTDLRHLTDLALLAVFWSSAAIGYGVAFAPPWNTDVAAILHFTQLWVEGHSLYIDLFDVNPPLIFMLSAPAALTATLFGLPAMVAWNLQLGALAVGMATCAWRIMRPRMAIGSLGFWVLAGLVPFLLLGFPMEHFGQREHVFIVLTVPYLALAARRAEGPVALSPAVLVGLGAAAIGAAIKPYFLLMPAAIELYVLLRRGARAWLRDGVPWLMGLVWLTYAAVILLVFPGFLAEIVPFALSVYTDIGEPPLYILLRPYTHRLLGAAVAIAVLAVAAVVLRFGEFSKVVAIAAVVAVVLPLVQAKQFAYHSLPAQMLLWLLLGAVAAEELGPDGERGARLTAAGLILVSAVSALDVRQSPWLQLRYSSSEVGQLSRTIEAHSPIGGRVVVMSSYLSDVFPAASHAERQVGVRFMSLFFLHAFYRDCDATGVRIEPSGAAAEWRDRLFREVVDDLVARPPDLIVERVRSRLIPDCGGQGFDYLGYYRGNPDIDALLADYALVKERGAFRYWRRT
ncbi:hypothetical protein [Elioraea sp.]|uniref:hypothetical protein n=1 Tax=Elioraea sp. TaxID=2185103 RepID=UPI003F725290